MTAEDAEAIVLYEGFARDNTPEDAIHIMVRMGEDPGRQRMSRLLTAIKVLFDAQSSQTTLDRRLAGALWTLGEVVGGNMESWARSGHKWDQEFEHDVVDLLTAIESFFYNVWVVVREE